MPTMDWFEWQGHHFRIAHATPQGDIFEYLPMEQWGERVKDIDADFVMLGHTHVQGMRTFGKTTVINPGSVGLARDGGGEACFAVLDDGQVHLKRVPYPVDRTIDALGKAPLPARVVEKLIAVLRTGKIRS
jgi:predicted phosphodiesterase